MFRQGRALSKEEGLGEEKEAEKKEEKNPKKSQSSGYNNTSSLSSQIQVLLTGSSLRVGRRKWLEKHKKGCSLHATSKNF